MLNIMVEVGSMIVAGGILVVLVEGAAKRQTGKITARIDEVEKNLATDNTSLGYGMEKLVTVEHIEKLKSDLKKELSKKKTKKSKAKRRKK